MGFYAPSQLVQDARAHGVEVRPIDVSASRWDSTLEGERVLRLGLRQIGGFREDWAEALEKARGLKQNAEHLYQDPLTLSLSKGLGPGVAPASPSAGCLQQPLRTDFDRLRTSGGGADFAQDALRPFTDIQDLAARTGLPARAMALLADADALGSLGQGRRQAGWDVRRLPPRQLSLFAAMEAPELAAEPDAALPVMPLSEEVVADYQTHRLSLKGHPMQFLRPRLAGEGVLSCAEVNAAKDGARVRCAGVVLVRQRPGKGNAVFITIEDETGVVNALLWARDFEKQRRPVMSARLAEIAGEIQCSKEGVVHLMAKRVTDRSALLARLDGTLPAGTKEGTPAVASRSRHPRNVRILPRSRDFH
jgi:DNA polymerase III alpha subunit